MAFSLAGSFAQSASGSTPQAIVAEPLTLQAADGALQIDRYTAPGSALRPAIVVLPGASGIAPFAAAYIRYARAFAASGFDAYLVSYASANAPSTSANPRDQITRRPTWRRRVGSALVLARRAPHASGAVGIIGFSLGGEIALSTASIDENVGAVTVFYGRLPQAEALHRLPPLLVVHGEADKTIPYAEGEKIVARAKGSGGSASILGYRGKDHGFDFLGGPAADSAMQQTIAFFKRELRR